MRRGGLWTSRTSMQVVQVDVTPSPLPAFYFGESPGGDNVCLRLEVITSRLTTAVYSVSHDTSAEEQRVYI